MFRSTTIDPETLRRIELAVHDAEQRTAGEIAVVITPRSARWSGQRVAFALATSTIAAVVLALVFQPHAGWMALAAPALFFVAWWIAGSGPLLRLLAGSRALDAVVERAAKVAFVDHGVHATRTRAGVLIYLSLLERRVHVLGDSAVHAVVGDNGWRSWADQLGGAMKAHHPESLLAIVRDLGALLAQRFPRGADDTNELADAVRVVRDAV